MGGAAGKAESAASLARYRSIGGGLFGKADINLIAAAENPKEGAPSVGDISLLGTVVGRSGMSYAIFQGTQSKKQEVSRIGDRVFDLGVLRSIEPNRATVDSNGRMLTFYLPQEKPPGAGSPEAKPASSSDRFSGVAQKSGSEWVIDQRALNNVLNNMGKVLTDARLLPYIDNGKVAGFRVSEIKPDGVFNLIGLKNGDVLVKVNDYSIDSPEKGVQLLTGLRGESRISLDVIRNGQPTKLNYQIR
jgi:general secretion pathway protein C